MFNSSNPPPIEELRDIFNRCAHHIETRYGINVLIADVIDPNTGDFNGATIMIDHDQDLESALFVLIHLFGHTVQWNTNEEWRLLGQNASLRYTEEADLARIAGYEREATGLSLALLHEVGVSNLDQWVSDWWAADWQYLKHFYSTGEKLDIRSVLRPGAELLDPVVIPKFTPQAWVSRWSF